MNIAIYQDYWCKNLLDIFRENKEDVRALWGTVNYVINEINTQKPFAVLLPPELQDGNVITFLDKFQNQASGVRPLFFVFGVNGKLFNKKVYRAHGADFVFDLSTSNEEIYDVVCKIYKTYQECGYENTQEELLNAEKALIEKTIKITLKANGFLEFESGYKFISILVYRMIVENMCVGKMKDLCVPVAEATGTTPHNVEQCIRLAIIRSFYRAQERNRPSIFSDMVFVPKPKRCIMLIVDEVKRNILTKKNKK